MLFISSRDGSTGTFVFRGAYDKYLLQDTDTCISRIVSGEYVWDNSKSISNIVSENLGFDVIFKSRSMLEVGGYVELNPLGVALYLSKDGTKLYVNLNNRTYTLGVRLTVENMGINFRIQYNSGGSLYGLVLVDLPVGVSSKGTFISMRDVVFQKDERCKTKVVSTLRFKSVEQDLNTFKRFVTLGG